MKKAIIILTILSLSLILPLSAQTPGSEKWSFTTGGNVYSSPAIGPDGTIYFGSDDNKLHAINPDGTEKWVFNTGGDVDSSPAISPDGTIYVGSMDNKLYAVMPNGTEKWAFDTGSDVDSSPAVGPDGTIYFGSDNDRVYAVNPDGTQKWVFTTGDMVYSAPAIGPDGTIYVGSRDNKLYAIDRDGREKWSFNASGTVYSPALDSDGTIYVGASYDKLYAINSDGTEKWSFDTGFYIYDSPAIGPDGTIYLGSSDNNIYALNPDGTEKWSFTTSNDVSSTPAVGSNGTIYVGSRDDKLYAVNPDGTEKWSFKCGGDIYSSPAIGPDGTIYVGSHDDKLHAVYSASSGLADSPWPKFRQNSMNTGYLRTFYLTNQCQFFLFNPGASIQTTFEALNPLSENITINDVLFDSPEFSLQTQLPLSIPANTDAILTVNIQPSTTGLYQSMGYITYDAGVLSGRSGGQTALSKANRTTSVQVSAGLFLDDDSELALSAHRALDGYNATRARNPKSIATKNNLGVLYRLLGEAELAENRLLAAVSDALNANYGYGGIKMNLGVVKSDQNESQEAETYYEVSLNDIANSLNTSALAHVIFYNQAWEAYRQADLTTAETQVTKTIQRIQNNAILKAKAYVLRGAVRLSQNDTTAARSDFQKALNLDPNGPIGRMAQDNIDMLTPIMVEIPLVLGWNLVSWNVNTSNDLAAVILAEIIGNVEIVLGYESGGLTFDPDLPQLSTLGELDHLHGYWIKMTKEDTLRITGPVARRADTQIHCEEGWNLVSYLPVDPDSASHAFSSMIDKIVVALGFNGAGLTFVPGMEAFNTLGILESMQGYWLKCDQEGDLSYPEPLPGVVPSQTLSKGILAMNRQRMDRNLQSLVMPTTEWISIYGQDIRLDDTLVPAGTVIKAVDPDSVICGICIVKTPGAFGLMGVYRDDRLSEMDEGAHPGDEITLFFGPYEVPVKVTWTEMGDVINLSEKILTEVGELRRPPTSYGLSQNYPNPFNPETKIAYQLPRATHTTLRIVNMLGQEVITLVDEVKEPGYHDVVWKRTDQQGRRVTSGLYLYILKAGDFTRTRKMVVMN